MNLQPDDRVLLLSVPTEAELLAMATTLTDGLLVGLASSDQIVSARRTVADFENTMFAPEDPEGVIPWRDHFFTVVFAPHLPALTDEIKRVLATGGTAYLATSTYIKPAEQTAT